MSNPYFTFKQFTIWHDKCAMKVGTDGVLLGAWAPVENCKRILDVGTGTGLIAIQLAQRAPQANITAVEIDKIAANQASDNVRNSPWANRIEVICADFRHYTPNERFDMIVSNPPYFINSLKCGNEQRNTARHTDELNYNLLFSHSATLLHERFDMIVSNPPYFINSLKCGNEQRNTARHTDELNYNLLFSHSATLLQPKGVLAIVIPAENQKAVIDVAGTYGYYAYRQMRLFTKPQKNCRRLLITFGFDPLHAYQEETLFITQENGQFSEEYKALTQDFYLKI